jgi:DNA-binding beta-propeller fold protein YncE
MVAANGTTTTLGGDGNPGFMDGTLGLDGGSEFSRPDWIAVDPPGRNVYVSDNGNCAIRVIHIDR